MSEFVGEPDSALRGTLVEMRRLLQGLQPALGVLIDQATELFRITAPIAPRPIDQGDMPFYFTFAEQDRPYFPEFGELTVTLGAGRWIKIFKTDSDRFPSFSDRMLWHVQPIPGDSDLSRLTKVDESRNPSRMKHDVPFEISVKKVDDRQINHGFVGQPYEDHEPFIRDAEEALDEAYGLVAMYAL